VRGITHHYLVEFKWVIDGWVGDGKNIKFWENKWVGDMPLQNLFARIFTNLERKEEVIGNMGEWRNGK